MGGLGNQLFQYSAMLYINKKNPGSTMFIDSREYKTYKVRDYELKSFKLSNSIQEYTESPYLYSVSRKAYHFFQYVYRQLFHKHAPMLPDFLVTRGYMYAMIDFKMPKSFNCKNLFMYGYFAKAEYLEEIRDELLKGIELKEDLSQRAQAYMVQIRKSSNPIAVSIRYGADYKNLGWPICNKKYYLNALKKIQEKVLDGEVFVFSDNLEAIVEEKWFEGVNVTYIEGCPVHESFTLLRSCSHFVTANSSFSWWGAWLSKNNEKIVYAPNHFYSFRHSRYDSLMHYDRMRYLDYLTGQEVEIK